MNFHMRSFPISLVLLLLIFHSFIVPNAAERKNPRPTPFPCPNKCQKAEFRAQLDCQRRGRPLPHCEVSNCPVNDNPSTSGWICAPRTTPTVNPTPIVVPTPTVQSSPDFISLTFTRGTPPIIDSITEPAVDGSGVSYSISYNMTLTDDGIVSLDAVESLVQIECNTDGSVRLRLSDEVPVTDLSSMYPKRAVLVISRELFGECNLAEESVIPGETDEERDFRSAAGNAALLTDVFLIIESVSGSPRDVVIRGTPTTYFALFDFAEISILPTEAPLGSSTSRELLPVLSRPVNIEFESNLLSIGPLSLKVTGNGESRGEFVSFTASWDLTSVDIEFKFINQFELSVSLDATLSAGVGISRTFVELVSIPLYGLPPIDFLASLDLGRFQLPTFKLGFFFEVPLIVRVDAMIQRDIANVARASYTTSRTEVTLFMKGPYLNVDIGADTRTLAPSSRSFDFTPSFSTNEETEITFTVFAGVRPQFAAYVPIFFARVSVEAGVQLEGTWSPGSEEAFSPLPSGGVPKFGICDECHDVEICGTGRIQNAGIFAGASVSLRVRVWRFNITIPINVQLVGITLPGNPSLSVDLAKLCLVEPQGENGPLHFIADTAQCESCPEELPSYNPTRQECEEECPDPDMPFFNRATEECEPCPADTPTYNEELQVCEANCPGGTESGNDVPFFGSFELGSPSGVFTFEREHFFIRDQITVLYEGAIIHDTGCARGSESINLSYSGNATNVVVNVTPNCDGTTGTAWTFSVSCPV